MVDEDAQLHELQSIFLNIWFYSNKPNLAGAELFKHDGTQCAAQWLNTDDLVPSVQVQPLD